MRGLSAILSALKALFSLLGMFQAEAGRRAGRSEVLRADAQALAKAEAKVRAIAAKGQTDAETVGSLDSGKF
jgi:regulator of protease activity HflC (stomatin/prohibitin superfamily)